MSRNSFITAITRLFAPLTSALAGLTRRRSQGGHEMPSNPHGCQAVIPLSDGIRLILGDGTVANLEVTTDDGDELLEVTQHVDAGVFGGIDHETRVEVGIIDDPDAVSHPRISDALEDLGFTTSGGCTCTGQDACDVCGGHHSDFPKGGRATDQTPDEEIVADFVDCSGAGGVS